MENSRNKRRIVGWSVLLALVLSGILGGVLAKYMTTRQERAEMLSSSFHFSSNYLEESPLPEYSVSDMSAINFELYNYEKTNLDSVSGEEITYTIKTDSPWGITVQDSNGNPVAPAVEGKTIYRIPVSDSQAVYQVTLRGGDPNRAVVVTAEATAPYHMKLRAKFNPHTTAPEYELQDLGNYCLLTVRSNDYSAPVTVKWDPQKVSPDNLNPLMASWTDQNPSQVFPAKKNTVYELIFVKNQNVKIQDQTGTGAVITIE